MSAAAGAGANGRAGAGRALALLAALVAAAWIDLGPSPDAPVEPAAAGRRLYEEGLLPSGRPLTGTVQGDVRVSGGLFACASCHRRSGYGGSEGGTWVPPITAGTLLAPAAFETGDLFRSVYREEQPGGFRQRVAQMKPRPAYDASSLLLALRDGVDPTGRRLDPTMPRYDLSARDVEVLLSWLRRLDPVGVPGVDNERIHLATVILPGVDPERRDAFLELARAFYRWRNVALANERRTAGHSPRFKDYELPAYRERVLHVWELQGPPASWRAQLEEHYRAQPVFALVSGLGLDWQEVHAFCEDFGLPCVLPSTELVGSSGQDHFTFYFSRGCLLEADALARHLAERGRADRVLTVVGSSPAERRTAQELGAALLRAGAPAPAECAGAPRGAQGWRALLAHQKPRALVLLDSTAPLEVLAGALSGQPLPERVFLPSSRQDELAAAPPELAPRLRALRPYALPRELEPRVFQDRSWIRSRGLALSCERIQLDTYFALMLAESALNHMQDRTSREYFMEGVEHNAEEALTFGSYSHLALGRDQRLASKGCYVVAWNPEAGALEAESDWIVP